MAVFFICEYKVVIIIENTNMELVSEPQKILPIYRVPKKKGVKRKTNEDFLLSIKDTKNPSIEVIGEYTTSKTKILCLCKICGAYYESLPNDIKLGRGHRICSNRQINLKNRLAPKEFADSISKINPNIQLLEDYVRSEDKILCRCLLCNYEWSAWPMNLKKGIGCPECAEKQRRITRHLKEVEKYLLYLKDTVKNVELVDEYIDTYTPILHKCLVCNNTWKIDPHHMNTRGACCPYCSGSKGEQRIRYFLDKYQVQYQPQKRYKGLIGTGNGSLSYDFYLPSYNLLIEFQGRQHEYGYSSWGGEEQLKRQKEHDRRKREYAKEHNINLLEIWYYDYNNIEEILTNYLNLETVETVIPA